MLNAQKHSTARAIDLSQNIMVETSVPSHAHSAMRSGFAGYPANPRWNAAKFRAWKMGRQWRDALKRGDLVVRTSDCMLIDASEWVEDPEEPSSPKLPYAVEDAQPALAAYQFA